MTPPGVGETEASVLVAQVVDEDQVDVYGPGSPVDFPGPAQFQLDGLGHVEQAVQFGDKLASPAGPAGIDHEDLVEKVRLVWQAPRRGFAYGATVHDGTDTGFQQVGGAIQ